MEITYEKIIPVIKSETWDNNIVRCTFQVDGKDPIQAFGQVPIDQNEIMKTAVKQSVKRGFIYSIFRGIGNFFGGMFGGIGGSVVSSGVDAVGYSVTSSNINNPNAYLPKLTPENKKQAVVNAFKTVSNFFQYDETNQRWTSTF